MGAPHEFLEGFIVLNAIREILAILDLRFKI